VLAMQNALEDAVASYCRALSLNSNHAETHNNLGNVQARLGNIAEAIAAYRGAIKLRPAFAEAWNNLGNVLLGEERADEAMAAWRNALAAKPGLAEAHNNVGHLLLQQGKVEEAMRSFHQALAAKPNYAEALSNLGAALGRQEMLGEAAELCFRAIAAKPAYAEAHCNLGSVLRKQGKIGEAEASCRKAIALKPSYADAYKQLGGILCDANRIEEGFAALTQYAELSYGTGIPLRPGPSVAHKIKHDREQYAYLTGSEPGEEDLIADNLRLADGHRVPGAAVNSRNNVVEIESRWRESRPQVVVIDHLLTDEALEKLRRYCWGSTIWRAIYEEGYLGALPEHGFASPLLAQIAEELRSTYPAIFAGHPLRYSWAFKYDSRLSGIKIHADFAAVNVNFWITPDEANLDPDRGGLVVWDVAAPLDWDFMKYNTAEKEIREFLSANGANPMTIPYRSNRAVIFDSDLFHETDDINFKDGYTNRRINITLLYGSRDKNSRTAE
jgi:tetratricopeptide (TPR) repeat protein